MQTVSYSKRAEKALAILREGGHVWVSTGHDFYGKAVAVIELFDKDKHKVKGFGIKTFNELFEEIDRKDRRNRYGWPNGAYRVIVKE